LLNVRYHCENVIFWYSSSMPVKAFFVLDSPSVTYVLGRYSRICLNRPPLWSNVQSSWLQIQSSRVRLPALPDFLRNSEVNWGNTWKDSSGSGIENRN
jgi:hypothetical protein